MTTQPPYVQALARTLRAALFAEVDSFVRKHPPAPMTPKKKDKKAQDRAFEDIWKDFPSSGYIASVTQNTADIALSMVAGVSAVFIESVSSTTSAHPLFVSARYRASLPVFKALLSRPGLQLQPQESAVISAFLLEPREERLISMTQLQPVMQALARCEPVSFCNTLSRIAEDRTQVDIMPLFDVRLGAMPMSSALAYDAFAKCIRSLCTAIDNTKKNEKKNAYAASIVRLIDAIDQSAVTDVIVQEFTAVLTVAQKLAKSDETAVRGMSLLSVLLRKGLFDIAAYKKTIAQHFSSKHYSLVLQQLRYYLVGQFEPLEFAVMQDKKPEAAEIRNARTRKYSVFSGSSSDGMNFAQESPEKVDLPSMTGNPDWVLDLILNKKVRLDDAFYGVFSEILTVIAKQGGTANLERVFSFLTTENQTAVLVRVLRVSGERRADLEPLISRVIPQCVQQLAVWNMGQQYTEEYIPVSLYTDRSAETLVVEAEAATPSADASHNASFSSSSQKETVEEDSLPDADVVMKPATKAKPEDPTWMASVSEFGELGNSETRQERQRKLQQQLAQRRLTREKLQTLRLFVEAVQCLPLLSDTSVLDGLDLGRYLVHMEPVLAITTSHALQALRSSRIPSMIVAALETIEVQTEAVIATLLDNLLINVMISGVGRADEQWVISAKRLAIVNLAHYSVTIRKIAFRLCRHLRVEMEPEALRLALYHIAALRTMTSANLGSHVVTHREGLITAYYGRVADLAAAGGLADVDEYVEDAYVWSFILRYLILEKSSEVVTTLRKRLADLPEITLSAETARKTKLYGPQFALIWTYSQILMASQFSDPVEVPAVVESPHVSENSHASESVEPAETTSGDDAAPKVDEPDSSPAQDGTAPPATEPEAQTTSEPSEPKEVEKLRVRFTSTVVVQSDVESVIPFVDALLPALASEVRWIAYGALFGLSSLPSAYLHVVIQQIAKVRPAKKGTPALTPAKVLTVLKHALLRVPFRVSDACFAPLAEYLASAMSHNPEDGLAATYALLSHVEEQNYNADPGVLQKLWNTSSTGVTAWRNLIACRLQASSGIAMDVLLSIEQAGFPVLDVTRLMNADIILSVPQRPFLLDALHRVLVPFSSMSTLPEPHSKLVAHEVHHGKYLEQVRRSYVEYPSYKTDLAVCSGVLEELVVVCLAYAERSYKAFEILLSLTHDVAPFRLETSESILLARVLAHSELLKERSTGIVKKGLVVGLGALVGPFLANIDLNNVDGEEIVDRLIAINNIKLFEEVCLAEANNIPRLIQMLMVRSASHILKGLYRKYPEAVLLPLVFELSAERYKETAGSVTAIAEYLKRAKSVVDVVKELVRDSNRFEVVQKHIHILIVYGILQYDHENCRAMLVTLLLNHSSDAFPLAYAIENDTMSRTEIATQLLSMFHSDAVSMEALQWMSTKNYRFSTRALFIYRHMLRPLNPRIVFLIESHLLRSVQALDKQARKTKKNFKRRLLWKILALADGESYMPSLMKTVESIKTLHAIAAVKEVPSIYYCAVALLKNRTTFRHALPLLECVANKATLEYDVPHDVILHFLLKNGLYDEKVERPTLRMVKLFSQGASWETLLACVLGALPFLIQTRELRDTDLRESLAIDLSYALDAQHPQLAEYKMTAYSSVVRLLKDYSNLDGEVEVERFLGNVATNLSLLFAETEYTSVKMFLEFMIRDNVTPTSLDAICCVAKALIDKAQAADKKPIASAVAPLLGYFGRVFTQHVFELIDVVHKETAGVEGLQTVVPADADDQAQQFALTIDDLSNIVLRESEILERDDASLSSITPESASPKQLVPRVAEQTSRTMRERTMSKLSTRMPKARMSNSPLQQRPPAPASPVQQTQHHREDSFKQQVSSRNDSKADSRVAQTPAKSSSQQANPPKSPEPKQEDKRQNIEIVMSDDEDDDVPPPEPAAKTHAQPQQQSQSQQQSPQQSHTRSQSQTRQSQPQQTPAKPPLERKSSNSSGVRKDHPKQESKTTSALTMILNDRQMREYFQAFVENNFDADGLNFYHAVREYQSETAPARAALKARVVIERFISLDSFDTVNINEATRKQILSSYSHSNGNPARDLFEKALEEVRQEMETSMFPLFLQSKEYAQLLESGLM